MFLLGAAFLFSGSVLFGQTGNSSGTAPTSSTQNMSGKRTDLKNDETKYKNLTEQIKDVKQNRATAEKNGHKMLAKEDRAKIKVLDRERSHDLKDMRKDARAIARNTHDKSVKKDVRGDVKQYRKESERIRDDKQNLQTAEKSGNKEVIAKDKAKLGMAEAHRITTARDIRGDVRPVMHHHGR